MSQASDLLGIQAGEEKVDEKDIITVERAAGTLPASTQAALFRVVNGPIEVVEIIGYITTVIQTQANNTKIVANPSTGSDTDLCAVLDVSADAVGSSWSITGTFANAMINTAAGVPLAKQATSFRVETGTIDLNCAATNTGAVKWKLRYKKINPNANVYAV